MWRFQNKEISMTKKNLLQIFDNIKNIFENRIKNNSSYYGYSQLIINNIFNDDFDLSSTEYLKNNDKPSLFYLKINENSEFYYLERNTVSILDVIKRQKEFYKILNLILKNLNKRDISFKHHTINNESNNNLEISLLHSATNNSELITWKYKLDFEHFFREIINNTHFENKLFLKFLKELWITIRNFSINKFENECLNFDYLSIEVEERMNLIFFNIAKRNYLFDDFELHKAVFENNLLQIRRICSMDTTKHLYCDVNEIDPHGNTPLMLAIKGNLIDAIRLLCDHDADIKHKSFENDISPLEYAIKNCNKKIILLLFNSIKKQKLSHWGDKKQTYMESLKNIPDFMLEFNLQFNSKILYFFNSILPTDKYIITKRGANLRIDMIINSKESSTSNSRYSILINDKNNVVNFYKLDHEKKICNDLIESIINDTREDDKEVIEFMKEGLKNTRIVTTSLQMTKFNQKAENILNYNCRKSKANCCVIIVKDKKEKLSITNNFTKYDDNYSKYIEEGIRTRAQFLFKIKHQIEKHLTDWDLIYSILFPISQNNSTIINRNSFILDQKEYLEMIEKSGSIKIKKKDIGMTVWISEEFPLKIYHFLPLLNIMSFINPQFSKLKSALNIKTLPFDKFPLKISYPLGISFYALLNITYFNLDVSINNLLFDESVYGNNYKVPINQLDDNYAKDFYEQYYLENNCNNQINNSIESRVKLLETSFNDEIEVSALGNSKKKEHPVYTNPSNKEEMTIKFNNNCYFFSEKISDLDLESNKYNKESKEKHFSNRQTNCTRNNNLNNRDTEELFNIDEVIPSEIHYKFNKIKSSNFMNTPKKNCRISFKMDEIKQKTLKCKIKPKCIPQLFKRKSNEYFDKQSNISSSLNITTQTASSFKLVNDMDVSYDIKPKVFQSKNNQDLFKVGKILINKKDNNESLFNVFITFCKKLLK